MDAAIFVVIVSGVIFAVDARMRWWRQNRWRDDLGDANSTDAPSRFGRLGSPLTGALSPVEKVVRP
jgi:hypothetical protein